MEERKKRPISEMDTGSNGLLDRIEKAKSRDRKEDEALDVVISKYMIITIGTRKYALYAEEVREIVGNVPIFYVPFTPPYIRGFINRHGEPYTVLDLQVVFDRESLDSSTFLILGREDDQLALLISEVIEIVKLPDSELHRITSTVDDEHYFMGSISPQEDGNEIFVLNLDNTLKKLENDLAAL
ncbi:MAG: chemotaxis protein CheW [Spirochaetales bacterium]|nr:chemotaxis protein CheW [Spirochaetales bacterium]